MNVDEIRVLPGERASLAESPVWLEESSTLCWVDMVAGSISTVGAGGALVRQRIAPYLGAIVPTVSGGLVALTRSAAARVLENDLEPMVTLSTDSNLRLNDAACDIDGRLWVGSTTVDGTPGLGALHVWDGGTPRVAVRGLTQPNGLGWSPDATTMYVVDTAVGTVYSGRVTRDGGLGSLQPLISMGDEQPDGLCVDSEGYLWVAMWDGGHIRRYSPSGALDDTVRLPVSRPTSCAFADDGLLFVTTARYGLTEKQASEQSWAGRVLGLPVGLSGTPVGRFAD